MTQHRDDERRARAIELARSTRELDGDALAHELAAVEVAHGILSVAELGELDELRSLSAAPRSSGYARRSCPSRDSRRA